jgi:hypothetical protein
MWSEFFNVITLSAIGAAGLTEIVRRALSLERSLHGSVAPKWQKSALMLGSSIIALLLSLIGVLYFGWAATDPLTAIALGSFSGLVMQAVVDKVKDRWLSSSDDSGGDLSL